MGLLCLRYSEFLHICRNIRFYNYGHLRPEIQGNTVVGKAGWLHARDSSDCALLYDGGLRGLGDSSHGP